MGTSHQRSTDAFCSGACDHPRSVRGLGAKPSGHSAEEPGLCLAGSGLGATPPQLLSPPSRSQGFRLANLLWTKEGEPPTWTPGGRRKGPGLLQRSGGA